MNQSTKPTLLVIDASSLLFRSYYGVRPLHTPDGMPTQAIYGFTRTIKKIIDSFTPTHMVLVWDTKGPTTRHTLYDQYKATRQAPPSDLSQQKEAIIEFANLVGIKQLWRQGHEADDLIASFTKAEDIQNSIIITGDKDLMQLLDDRTSIFDPFKQKTITRQSFIEERNFEPKHLLLYHTLLGDSSDNIPGVRGVGAKSAQVLTEQYQTRENLYAHIDQVTPNRVANALKAYEADALLSEKLFTLHYPETETSIDKCALSLGEWKKSASFFARYHITPFAPKGTEAGDAPAVAAKPAAPFTAHCITTESALIELCEKIKTADIIALDTETTSLTPFRDEMVGLSIALSPDEGFYLPFGHHDEAPQLSREIIFKHIAPLISDPAIKKVLHHAKFDCAAFGRYDVAVEGIVDDTLIIASLLRTGSQKIGLKALSTRYLGEEMETYDHLVKGKKTFADVSVADAASYAVHDAIQTLKLRTHLTPLLEKDALIASLYRNVELPLSALLWKMELYGITLDTQVLAELATHVEAELAGIITKIQACLDGGQLTIIPGTINLNSPQQVEHLLFDQLRLPVIKKNSKSGSRSTDSEVLAELSKVHPVPGLIIQYRELNKLLSTYLRPLPAEINPRTGRIHTTYTQTITATGRLSSVSPNLQNIPIAKGYGNKVRSAFVAPEKMVFISADYSQIELRILAELSKDPVLVAAFNNGEDIHTKTASKLFDVAESEVSAQQRQVGKKINFSILYGLTPFGLAKDLGISPAQAKEYIEQYFDTYKGVREWMDQLIAQAKEEGFVQTLLGRRRAVPGLWERNRNLQEAERRIAINTPIQGTSADIIKMAMLALDEALKSNNTGAHIVLQIHDELIIAAPETKAQSLEPLITTTMTSIVKNWVVPLTVSIRSGRTWGDVSK